MLSPISVIGALRVYIVALDSDNKYLSCVYGVDRKICHEGH